MDRAIVYNGQLPLETDVLNSNLFAMIGLGRLAMDVIGTSDAVSGLACTPTSPASMSVAIGAGAFYRLENIDNTAYSSLPANTVDQIVKQGILKASDALTLPMTAPTTSGYSVIYLIQAAYQDVDSGSAVLNYYNATDPSVPFTGPNNNSASQPTVRSGGISITAKAGAAAASPVAPSPDAGYVGLYQVTISYGQTTITSGNISTVSGAPFLAGTLASLANFLTISAAASTYLTQASASATYATLASQFGVGQTWQNMAGSRVLGATYTNTTGRPIMVSVNVNYASGGSNTWTLTVGGVPVGYNSGNSSTNTTGTLTAIVPPGATYSASVGIGTVSLNTWNELR